MSTESWQPDGWDAQVRIGVLAPHADVGPESELQAMAPPGVRIHGARVLFTAMGPGGAMDPTIPHAPILAFAAPLVERLRTRTGDVAVVSTCLSIVAGLRELGISRIALFDPPWFDAKLTGLGRDLYADQGFEVVHAASCALPYAQSAIRPADLFDQIGTHTPDSADAVVVGGNGFRAVGVIDAIEHALGRPMLTPNQALLWGTLRAADADVAAPGYGRLLLEARVRAGY